MAETRCMMMLLVLLHYSEQITQLAFRNTNIVNALEILNQRLEDEKVHLYDTGGYTIILFTF